MSDTYCEICGEDVGWSSHYHCPNCGGECSMMGHVNFITKEYKCEYKAGPWSDEGYDDDEHQDRTGWGSVLDERSRE